MLAPRLMEKQLNLETVNKKLMIIEQNIDRARNTHN
jgi:hypothetical protein